MLVYGAENVDGEVEDILKRFPKLIKQKQRIERNPAIIPTTNAINMLEILQRGAGQKMTTSRDVHYASTCLT